MNRIIRVRGSMTCSVVARSSRPVWLVDVAEAFLHAALPRPFHVVPSMLPRFIRDCDQEDEDDPGDA